MPTSLIEVPEGQEWIREMITNILVEVLSSMAEQERPTIRLRQREGIEAAKAKGKHLGRPKAVMPEHFPRIYDEWKQGKIKTKQAVEILELKPTTFYRLVKQYESK